MELIDRQAAIDALWAERMKLSEEMERNLETCSFALRADNKARRNRVEEDIEIIKQLPPAQPEIIRCKDCKYRMPYDWMFSETWQSQNMDDYPDDEIGCLYCDMAMNADDYCSRAERRERSAE